MVILIFKKWWHNKWWWLYYYTTLYIYTLTIWLFIHLLHIYGHSLLPSSVAAAAVAVIIILLSVVGYSIFGHWIKMNCREKIYWNTISSFYFIYINREMIILELLSLCLSLHGKHLFQHNDHDVLSFEYNSIFVSRILWLVLSIDGKLLFMMMMICCFRWF